MEAKRRKILQRIAPITVAILLLGLLPASAAADDISQSKGFRKGVTVAGIREHEQAWQDFGNANGGNRASGTGGYDASAQYAYDRMAAAGYDVSFQEFTFTFVGDRTPPHLEQLSPVAKTYADRVDFATMSYSGSGDVTASVSAVDLIVPSPTPNASTSGCEAADFAGFTVGHIALMQRGTCTFRTKAVNAISAGASGAIIFNEGNPGRTGLQLGTLSPPQVALPVVGATFALGDELRNGVLNGPTGVSVHLRTDVLAEVRTTRNVIAETPTGDPDNVVVVGGHLDSTPSTVGMNDNGSGPAVLLEIAEVYAAQDRIPRNKLRFIWFAAEEFGLIGSRFYVDSLSPAALAQIRLYLNFDMLGSPNYVRFVYDGDNSTFPAGTGVQAGPLGSGTIEQIWLDYFAAQGLATDPTPLTGNTDYAPFASAGVPIGGLFTGAGALKTAAQAVTYGGTAGAPYDACNHLACDDFSNQNLTVLDQMSDAAAHTILLLSKRNFANDPLSASSPATAHLRVTSGSLSGGGEPTPAMANLGEAR